MAGEVLKGAEKNRQRNAMRLVIFAVVVAVCDFLLAEAPAQGQNAMALGQQAEQAGNVREAVRQYTMALHGLSSGSNDEQQLRGKIIDLVRGLDPKPAISEEAERRFISGGVLAKQAKSVEDHARAAAEFREALKLAPWWADAYINEAVVQEQAQRPDAAIRSLKLYLRISPDGPDATQIRRKIFALEVAAEDQAFKRFEGVWAINSA